MESRIYKQPRNSRDSLRSYQSNGGRPVSTSHIARQGMQPSAASSTHAALQDTRYAIVQLGGVRHMVEEGHQYTCLKSVLDQARFDSASRSIVLHNVLGLRDNGQFLVGRPYVPNAAVEVEVLEEFPGPVPHSTAVAAADTTMAIYRVKQISPHNSSSAQQ